jgi:hypothetical protein
VNSDNASLKTMEQTDLLSLLETEQQEDQKQGTHNSPIL